MLLIYSKVPQNSRCINKVIFCECWGYIFFYNNMFDWKGTKILYAMLQGIPVNKNKEERLKNRMLKLLGFQHDNDQHMEAIENQ